MKTFNSKEDPGINSELEWIKQQIYRQAEPKDWVWIAGPIGSYLRDAENKIENGAGINDPEIIKLLENYEILKALFLDNHPQKTEWPEGLLETVFFKKSKYGS